MIEKSYRSLSVGARCCLLSISQSSFYNAQGERPNHVRRHHLHPDALRFPLSGGHHGLVHPQGSSLTGIEQA